jgi:3-hydroxyacyl-CoA dehydrogenase/enoyl-CoA hydratase/3-hydroxybutyryl-CoA epimerase
MRASSIDDPKLKLGQPEVKLGLLPGGGGTVRLPRLVGIQQALQICAEGNDIAPAKALGMGLITALAKDRDDLMARRAPGSPPTPRPGSPGTSPSSASPAAIRARPAVVQMLAIAPSASPAAKSWGNYPAITHIMSSVFEGCLLDFDAACVVESRYFAACVHEPAKRRT